jgi:hypothetical protein
MLKDWCIPCPDHIIVEHDKVAPMGPTLGDFVGSQRPQGLKMVQKRPSQGGQFIAIRGTSCRKQTTLLYLGQIDGL